MLDRKNTENNVTEIKLEKENEKKNRWQQVCEVIATAPWMDLIGLLLVMGVAYSAGYANETLGQVAKWSIALGIASLPFGWISIGNTGLSIMSTRLTGRMKYLGNVVGIINVVLSGTIDYILGNKAAIISYPVTFLIYIAALIVWKKYENAHKADLAAKPLTGKKRTIIMSAIFSFSFIFSFVINYIGFQNLSLLFWLTWIVFALSLIANILNAMKLSLQNNYWIMYNIVQLIKNAVQLNFANVGKYIYYIISMIAAYFYWNARNPQSDINSDKNNSAKHISKKQLQLN